MSKYMDIREFREQGYLQEANRLFFHPLGLSLVVECVDCPQCVAVTGTINEHCAICAGVGEDPSGGEEVLIGIRDYRDASEGVIFAWPEWKHADPGDVRDKANRVSNERYKHYSYRANLFDDMYKNIPRNNRDIEPIIWNKRG